MKKLQNYNGTTFNRNFNNNSKKSNRVNSNSVGDMITRALSGGGIDGTYMRALIFRLKTKVDLIADTSHFGTFTQMNLRRMEVRFTGTTIQPMKPELKI